MPAATLTTRTVHARQGDTLDALLHRHTGRTVVAPSLTPDSYTLTPAKPAPRLAERGFSFV